MSECAVEPVVTVTLTWGEDPGASLVLPPACEDPSGLWWNALALPDWSMRYSYAPPSAWVSGSMLLSAVPDASSVPLVVAARGTDLADLEVQKASLAAALAQWSYTVDVVADPGGGDPLVSLGQYAGQPTIPRWGAVTPQRARLYVAEAQVLIPVNPAGAP